MSREDCDYCQGKKTLAVGRINLAPPPPISPSSSFPPRMALSAFLHRDRDQNREHLAQLKLNQLAEQIGIALAGIERIENEFHVFLRPGPTAIRNCSTEDPEPDRSEVSPLVECIERETKRLMDLNERIRLILARCEV